MENNKNLTPIQSHPHGGGEGEIEVDTIPSSQPTSFLQTLKNSKAAQVARNFMFVGGLMIGANAMTSCDTKTVEPEKPVQEDKKETDLYTPEEWVAKNDIKLESELFHEGRPTGLIAVPIVVTGDDGKYYLKPEFKLDMSTITEKSDQIVERSGYNYEDIYVYVNIHNQDNDIETQQGFQLSYLDVINSDGDIIVSKMIPNPNVTGNDLEKIYIPGHNLMISISVQLNSEIREYLKKSGIMTPQNQREFDKFEVFIYKIGK